MSSDQTVRVGFVGAGYVANRHAGSLSQLPGVRIAAVADPQAERAQRFAEVTGARPYGAHGEMLAREKLDAVYICVPPGAHGEPERAVLERRLPFFVEKPVASDLRTAEEIAAAVSAADVPTATGYHWRYLDTVERAAELLADTPPLLVLGFWLDRTPGTGWWARQDQSGGQLVEQGTHLFDLARLLVGEVEVAHAAGVHRPGADPGEIHRAATSTLRFASGATGTIAATSMLTTGYRIGIEFFCAGRTVALSEGELTVDEGRRRWSVMAEADAFAREDADFIDAVRGGPSRIRAPYEEALKTHRLACAAAVAAQADAVVGVSGRE